MRGLAAVLAGVIGILAATQVSCRPSTAVAGLFLAVMGGLFVLSGRKATTGTPMNRAQQRAWRASGPALAAFGAALAVGALAGYLLAGPGTCS